MLEHGGRVRQAAARFGIAEADWLDLSTGINPQAYPVPALSAESWRRLPEDGDGLEAAAAAYYGTPRLLATPGSQAVIQTLPTLIRKSLVGVLAPTYAEHPQAWRRAGHTVFRFPIGDLEAAAARADVLLVCAPNNPDAGRCRRERLLEVAAKLRARRGLLVVDEAFADAFDSGNGDALVALAGGATAPNLIVLRSLGKFFGLAGARVGFVAAAAESLAALREALGPWAVSGPARAVATAALADRDWQQATRRQLAAADERLAQVLAPLGATRAAALFRWLPTPAASDLHAAFGRRGILLRLFDDAADGSGAVGLRVGLPGDETQWRRLADAVEKLK